MYVCMYSMYIYNMYIICMYIYIGICYMYVSFLDIGMNIYIYTYVDIARERERVSE